MQAIGGPERKRPIQMAMRRPSAAIVVARFTSTASLRLVALTWLAHWVGALEMLNLDAPDTAVQGDSIKLACSFALERQQTTVPALQMLQNQAKPEGPTADGREAEAHRQLGQEIKVAQAANRKPLARSQRGASGGELLYAVKWYKDEREFFRFLAQGWPKKLALPLDGLLVDVDKSDNQTVVLKDVGLRTGGIFKCEVSTDAPTFITKSLSRKILIYSLPEAGPTIELQNQAIISGAFGGQTKPAAGGLDVPLTSVLSATCRAPSSKPAAQLDWIINDSLNLSSLAEKKNFKGQFSIKTRLFVRLQQADGLKLRAKQPFQPHKSPQLPSNGPGAEYELENSTWAKLADSTNSGTSSPNQGPPINVVGFLDQLPESASSQLNLTLDQNLLHLLNTRLKPSSANLQPLKQTKPTLLRSAFQTKSTLNDDSSLKIKCVARVLHVYLTDEIKIKVSRRHPGMANIAIKEDSDKVNQQRQKWNRDESSGLSKNGFLNMWLILLLSSILVHVLMPRITSIVS